DPGGNEVIRNGAGGFLGEINLLTGQTVYLSAVATEPLRYIAVEREQLRELLQDDGPLSDVLLGAFMARREALQQREGIGFEIVGPRSSASTRALVDYARRGRLAFTWLDTEHEPSPLVDGLSAEELPLVRLPGGPTSGTPRRARSRGRSASAWSWPRARRSISS